MKAGEIVAGRYELRGVLGRGGMAEVRDGWDLRLSRAVAIKLLHPGLSAQPENRLRLEAEARAAATLSSPHIVVIHDSGEHDGTPFIVMERLPGVSLADRIENGPLPQPLVRAVLDGVLAALAVAHEAGILHRDIKPGNILFTATGETKVTDFGIAKTAQAAYTMTGQILGTMAYLSPERLTGSPATASDDLYAAGVVGYEALAGRRPFTQQEPGPLAHAIVSQRPPPLAALRRDVDPGLATVIERAMAYHPVARFGSAEQMRAALWGAQPLAFAPRPTTRVLEEPLPPPPTVAQWVDIPHSSRTRKLLAAAAILAVLALVLILLAVESPSSGPPAPATTSTPVPTVTTTSTLPSTTTPTPAPLPPPGRHPGKKGGQQGD
jgi:serine/threonine protein kinase